jgi:hypothetical protein
VSDALDIAERSSLESLIGKARSILEGDLANIAAGRYGIDTSGSLANEEDLRLDASELAARREIVAIMTHLRSEGLGPAAAVSRLLREAVFTHLNRLVAIRIAEAIGLLPPSLAQGRSSQGFRDLLEAAPLLASDDTGGYWIYLQLCGDELAGDVPTLFDPRNPLLALAPSPGALDDLLDLLARPTESRLWTAPDCLGWAYQFFNTGDERRAMREESSAPRDSRELAVRNQFFTPRYVVDFLVQNSLGRRLMDSDPASALLHDLPLLVDPPKEKGAQAFLGNISVLDPACGSGHFLLASYDILERAWDHVGVNAEEAAPAIVRSLWGIEIDPRCVQVAAAAVIFRARRSCHHLELPRPNIICARSLPATTTGLDNILSTLSARDSRLIQHLTERLGDAPVLGPLLKIEQSMTTGAKAAIIGGPPLPGTLADSISDDALESQENELLAALSKIANSTTASPPERLLAAEADDTVRLIQALRHRYDVVLMNPPFGLPVETVEPYLKSTYPDTWTELYAAFIERGRSLCLPQGYCGALVSSQFFVTRTLRAFRKLLIEQCNPTVLVDLGSGVLQGATVSTCMLVVPASNRCGTTNYADLTKEDRSFLASSVSNLPSSMKLIDFKLFSRIEGTPLAVHMPAAILERWASGNRLEPALGIVRTGNHTFDDFRFLRCWWEVQGAGWLPFQKGGNYRPYWASAYLVLDWRRDGKGLKSAAIERIGSTAQVMQSSSMWFKPGLTYPRVSSIGFGARILPEGEIFSSESISIFPKDGIDPLVLLGLLNSTFTAEILQVFGRFRKYENRAIKALPFSADDIDALRDIHDNVMQLVRTFHELESMDETTTVFRAPWPSEDVASCRQMGVYLENLLLECKEHQAEIDEAISVALSVQEGFDPSVQRRDHLIARAFPAVPKDPEWLHSILSYLLGVAFGRWQPSTSNEFDRIEHPFSRIDHRRPVDRSLPVEANGNTETVSIPSAGMLLDEQGHWWDIESRILTASEDCGAPPGLEEELFRLLRRTTLREYLRKQFFKDHLVRYSKSRRKAPIYWPLYVPSGKWGVWIYAPTLTRETIFAIVRSVTERLDSAQAEIRRLQSERATGGAGRSVRDVTSALEAEEELVRELQRFREEAERIAQLGWLPDLDDGMMLCAAPLAGLFPAWRDAAIARQEIKAGKYPWASVSHWARNL